MEKIGKAIEILSLISRNARSAWEALRIDETLNNAAKRLQGVESKDIPHLDVEQHAPNSGKEEIWHNTATGEEIKVWVYDNPNNEDEAEQDCPYEKPQSTPEEMANELEQALLWYLSDALKETDEAQAALDFCLFPLFNSLDEYYKYPQRAYVDKVVIDRVTRQYPRITETDLRMEWLALSSNPTMQKQVAQMVEDAMSFPNIQEYRNVAYDVDNGWGYDTHYTWPCLEFLNGRKFGGDLEGDIYKLQTMVRSFGSACENLRSIYSEQSVVVDISKSLVGLFNGHTDYVNKLAGLTLDKIVANIKNWAQFRHKDGKFICQNPASNNKSAYARALIEAGLTTYSEQTVRKVFQRGTQK